MLMKQGQWWWEGNGSGGLVQCLTDLNLSYLHPSLCLRSLLKWFQAQAVKASGVVFGPVRFSSLAVQCWIQFETSRVIHSTLLG